MEHCQIYTFRLLLWIGLLARLREVLGFVGTTHSSNELYTVSLSHRVPSKNDRSCLHSKLQNIADEGAVERRDQLARTVSRRTRRGFFLTAATTTTTFFSSTVLATSPASAVTPPSYLVPTPPLTKDTYWPIGKVAFSLLPLAGTRTRRKTLQETVIPNLMWTHDQIQGIVNVNVPVRQIVVKLSNSSGGGLWVYNPVAPTPEMLRHMHSLEAQHGPVRHIVLGTVALEHKAAFCSFCRQYPNASAWVQPGQWSFPLNLPLSFYGLPQVGSNRLQELPTTINPSGSRNSLPEWAHDFDFEILGPFHFQSVGAFSETAFYHKSTHSLLVTDVVCSVTKDAPAIIQEDPRALLFHARNNAMELATDDAETRQRGWRRMVQFGLVFFPSQIEVKTVSQALRESQQVPSPMRNLGAGAIPGDTLYPWSWKDDTVDVPSFDAISQDGKLFCPPILTKLILDREPVATLAWVDRVTTRFGDMQRVVPCHLNNAVVRPDGNLAREFSEAFDPLRSTLENPQSQRALPQDLALLQQASDILTRYGVVSPSQVCDGEPARIVGRFARTRS
jgi:hypothetical protein